MCVCVRERARAAPDTNEYYHNVQWSSDKEANRRQQPDHAGSNYFDEDPEMWTTTVGVRLSPPSAPVEYP